MNEDARVLGQLSAYLQSLPNHAPESLLRTTLATVAKTRQRRAWWPAGPLPTIDWRVSRTVFASVAAIAALIVVIVFAQVVGRLPTNLPPASQPVVAPSVTSPAPTASRLVTSTPQPTGSPNPVSTPMSGAVFEQPFTYEIPAGVTVSVDRVEQKIVSITASTDQANPTATLSPKPHELYPIFRSGLVIASSTGALLDACPRHIGGHTIAPGEDVATLLRDYAGFTFATTDTTVGGSPATVTSDVGATCLDHFHVGGNGQDGSMTMALDRADEEIYFVPVGDTTVVMQIWGSEDWFPVARSIVQSIVFTGDHPFATESPEAVEQSVTAFDKPFSFERPPAQLALPWLTNRVVAMLSPTSAATDDWPTLDLYPSASNGILFVSTASAQLDTCPRRIASFVTVQPEADFAAVLRDQGGFSFEATPVTIGGRDGSRLSGVSATCLDHLHTPGVIGGEPPVSLAKPFQQLYLVPFEDTTVLIQIWAHSQAEFDAWLPVAEDVIETLDFSKSVQARVR